METLPQTETAQIIVNEYNADDLIGWTPCYLDTMGTIQLNNPKSKKTVYATPYFTNNNGIDIEVEYPDGTYKTAFIHFSGTVQELVSKYATLLNPVLTFID